MHSTGTRGSRRRPLRDTDLQRCTTCGRWLPEHQLGRHRVYGPDGRRWAYCFGA